MDLESPNLESEFEQQFVATAQPRRTYFEGEVPTIRLGRGYGIGLLVVLLAMIALPLIYIGLIATVVWGIWWYATRMQDVFFPLIGGTRQVYFALTILYLMPIFAGVMLVGFMLRPLFPRFRLLQFSKPIGHVENPELFRFLGELCQLLGAPIPSRVDVQLGVNASASFRAGFSSMFGNDIKLSIGLPVIAGLTCAEFAGIMAHELGHFRQGAAMRFYYVIATVNAWFHRAVYDREERDLWVSGETQSSVIAMLAVGAAQIGIAFTRGILWVLMMCGHAVSAFLSRQMELDADASALSIVGTDTFLSLNHKMMILGFAEHQVFDDFRKRLEKKLPDDLSTYIALVASQCAGEIQGKIARASAGQKGRWYDTHPSRKERNDRAFAANLPGLICDQRSATCLFGDFSKLSKEFTGAFYSFFGRPPPPDQIFQVQAQANTVPDTTDQEAFLKKFFGGLGPVIKPILLEMDARPALLSGDKLEQLQSARALLVKNDLMLAREKLKALDTRLLEALQNRALRQGGVVQEMESASGDDPVIAQIIGEWNRVASEIEPFEKAAKDRLLILLSLVRSPGMSARLGNTQALQDEAQDLKHVFAALSHAFPALLALRQQFAKLQALLPYRVQGSSELLDAVIANETTESARLLGEIQRALGATAYPFRHLKAHVSVIDFARTKEFTPDPVLMTYKEAESYLQMLFALYFQVLGRLAAIAIQVEEALGEKRP